MNIISCAGYFGTGSSAVTDFFSEFDNVKSLGETEFKFLQDVDGVQALEMNLIEHPHRHNSGHAIKRFLKASRFENGNIFSKRYRQFFGEKYMKFTLEYIKDITQLQAECHWRGDAIERGECFYMLDALLSKITRKMGRKPAMSILTLLHEQNYFTTIDRESFYKATKKYTSNLFGCVSDGSEYLMVDQLTPPTEVSKYMNYVENLKVIVVDRDPRDVFVENAIAVPHLKAIPDKVEEFCEWYRILREHRKVESPRPDVLFINFEDMICRYDETKAVLTNFLGIDPIHHKNLKSKFDPSISKKNTRKWEMWPNRKSDIDYIERQLCDFLYPY